MINRKRFDLKTIDKTIASRQHEIGIKNEFQLRKLGLDAAKVYK